MRFTFHNLALAATLLSPLLPPCVLADVHSNKPVQHLIDTANTLLAQGDMNGALDHFDAAIKRDPSNYLTLFKRGATYLSLGKSSQATADFDAVLSMKPDFEAALLQRARLRAKAGKWRASKNDYKRTGGHADEVAEVEEAEKAEKAAKKAKKEKDYETCVEKAGLAIRTASQSEELRALRARCRLARGEVYEAVGDLSHVAAFNPESTATHLKIASLLFYNLGEPERARQQLIACLKYDDENKLCKKHLRRIKALAKLLEKAKTLREKRQFHSATKVLAGVGDDQGVIDDVKGDIEALKKDGYLNEQTGSGPLMERMLEMTCDAYMEMNNHKRAAPYCDALLEHNPTSIPAVISKAKRLIDEDKFEEAIALLEQAKRDNDQGDQRLMELSHKAQMLLRRSKQKDYYKILGVSRDADKSEIKKTYRKLAKEFHPDVYRGDMPKEDVEKKSHELREAYDVLIDDELRARFDRGDDPNDPMGQQQQGNPFGGFGGGFGGPFGQGGQQQFVFRSGGQGEGFPFGQGAGGFKFNF